MYRVWNNRKRVMIEARSETDLLALGFTPEEIIAGLVGVPVRGCVIRYESRVSVIDPCTMDEIADITGLSKFTVNNIVRRALERMRQKGKLKEFLQGVRAMRRVSVEITE